MTKKRKGSYILKIIAERIIGARWFIISLSAAITLVMGYFLKNLQVDPDVFNYLPEDDQKASLFKSVGERYGGNYIGIIGLETENVFTRKVLEDIKEITDTLRYLDGVGTVTSLTNVIDIRGSDWGIEVTKLVDVYDMPKTKQELDSLRDYTLSQDMYRGTLVSEDASFTAIMVKIREGVDKIKVAGRIKDIVNGLGLDEKVYFGGMPFAIKGLAEIIMGDMLFLAPITALVIILILFLSFRSFRGVLLPLMTVAVSVIWTLGLMGLLGIKISIISDTIPVILLAVGSAYTIHVVNRVNSDRSEDPRQDLQKSLEYIIVPVSLAAITTMVGFISFIFGSYLTMISTFGIFMAAGVAFALILSVTLAPAVMAVFPGKARTNETNRHKINLFDNLLVWLNKKIIRQPRRVLAVWLILVVAALAGSFQVQRKVDINDYFKKDDPNHVAEQILREKFGGSMPVYVVVDGDVQDPEVLETMERIGHFMEKTGKVVHAQSVADMVSEMNEVMGEGYTIPADKLKIEQLWILLEGQDVMEQLVRYDLKEGLINSTFNTGDVDDMKLFVSELQNFIDQNQSETCQASFTGLPSLYLRIDHSLISSQLQSVLYAILLVFTVITLILRSLKSGGLALIPISVTLLVLFGFMGWARIPLDLATVLVGSVSIGIGIDYAIHMITHLKHESDQGKTMQEATGHAIAITGRAIMINMLSVAAGFLVLLLSNLVPLQRFGLLVAITMVTSASAAITLLPAVLLLIAKKKKV